MKVSFDQAAVRGLGNGDYYRQLRFLRDQHHEVGHYLKPWQGDLKMHEVVAFENNVANNLAIDYPVGTNNACTRWALLPYFRWHGAVSQLNALSSFILNSIG